MNVDDRNGVSREKARRYYFVLTAPSGTQGPQVSRACEKSNPGSAGSAPSRGSIANLITRLVEQAIEGEFRSRQAQLRGLVAINGIGGG